jgi:hypothetical protein
MIPFIAGRIEEARAKSLLEGQAKYKAYFINTHLYLKYKSGVDTILETDGYGDCIVA